MSSPPNATYTIIPALNEEDCIASVISHLREKGLQHIIVVDNGSTDRTTEKAQFAGATVVQEPKKGYGRACLTGIRHLPHDTQWVLFCDADGSDDLSELSKFWVEVETSDFIIGNRRATSEGRSNLTPVQNFGNWLSGILMRLGWGKGFSDLGPLRLIRYEALQNLEMEDTNFGWTVEMQAKVLERKTPFTEVPVNYLPRQGGVSKISGNFKASAKAGQIILSTLAKLWLGKSQRLLALWCWLLMGCGALWMGLQGDPTSPSGIIPFFGGAVFLSVGYLLSLATEFSKLSHLLLFASLLRILLLPMPPGDDIWRYIWEGMIQLTGHNPYNTAPDHVSLLELRPSWWRHINNENVTAIYPPLAQLIFRLTAGVSASVIGFKVLFVLADILTGALLWKKDTKLAAFYLLNPLILYCFAGGAHYEPLFLLPLIASWLIWETKPSGSSLLTVGLLIGTSLAIKLIAIFSGYYVLWQLILSFMRKPHVRQAKHIASFLLGIFLVPTLSLVGFCYLSGIPDQWYPSTFVEDARSASLIPWFLEHYNSDPHFPYPNSLFACLLAVLLVPIFLFSKTFHGLQRRTLLTLLVCSPMVHAWYFTWLIPFCVKGHRIVIGFLSTTAFLYFLLPYRLATEGKWDLLTVERLLLWSPYLLLITTPLAYLRKTKS